jgi:hypothetical protein
VYPPQHQLHAEHTVFLSLPLDLFQAHKAKNWQAKEGAATKVRSRRHACRHRSTRAGVAMVLFGCGRSWWCFGSVGQDAPMLPVPHMVCGHNSTSGVGSGNDAVLFLAKV